MDSSAACRPQLSRSVRIIMDAAILRVCEADRIVGLALLTAEPLRLADAAVGLDQARAALAEAGRDASYDAARRRSISLV